MLVLPVPSLLVFHVPALPVLALPVLARGEALYTCLKALSYAIKASSYAAQQHASGRQGPADAIANRTAARGCLTQTCRGQC